jgi:radical SAM protein with 4Fe4S-binding SPASM domain
MLVKTKKKISAITKLLNKVTMSVVPFKSAIRSLFILKVDYTPRRVWNYIKVFVSMHLSKLLRKQIVWGFPPLLMVEPTNICNLQCPMCPSGNGEMARARGKLDPQNFKKVMDDVGNYIYQVQFWNQGEPFINKSFLDMVRYAKTKGVMTQTSTNGHFIRTDAIAEEVVAAGLDQIIFSMDGTNQETYEKYRVGGNYNLVIETLGRLSKAKDKLKSRTPLIELQFLVFKHNQDEIDQLIQIAKKHKVNRIAFKSVQVYSAEQAQEFLPDDEHLTRYSYDGESYEMKSEMENWCRRLWMNSTINWDGSVSPCCFDKDADYAFGNIFDNGAAFNDIWRNQNYMNFRKKVMKNRKNIDMCSNCTEGMKQPYVRIVELDDL